MYEERRHDAATSLRNRTRIAEYLHLRLELGSRAQRSVAAGSPPVATVP
jgi:hypothetical protein